MKRGLEHTMRVRRSAPGQFMDVRFEDTVKRPLEVARAIYRFIDWPLDEATEGRMARWLAEDEKSHAGGHDYSPEQFGLSADGLRRDFAAYRERHIEAATAAA